MLPFRAAVEAGDLDAIVACLAEDVVFNSPVVFKSYEGRLATATILAAVFEVFEGFAYTDEIDGGDMHALLFRARAGDKEVQGIDILRIRADGLVAELTVMLRPLSGTLAVAEAMRAKLTAA